jgi:hypothetical protein
MGGRAAKRMAKHLLQGDALETEEWVPFSTVDAVGLSTQLLRIKLAVDQRLLGKRNVESAFEKLITGFYIVH